MLTRKEEKSLRELCQIFDITLAATNDNKAHALGILTGLYAYLSVEGDYAKRRHRDAILQDTARVWGMNSEFFGDVQLTVAGLMARPAVYVDNRKSNSALITQFQGFLFGVFLLEILGVGGLGGATWGSASKGAEEAIKRNSVRAGLDAAKRRLLLGAGSGIVEAVATRAGLAMGLWGAALVAVLVAAHHLMLRKLEQIRTEMQERYEVGDATLEELDKVQNKTFFEILADGLEPYWR